MPWRLDFLSRVRRISAHYQYLEIAWQLRQRLPVGATNRHDRTPPSLEMGGVGVGDARRTLPTIKACVAPE